MRRSIRKAVAFFVFLAMVLELFVVPDVTPVRAAEAQTKFVYDEYSGSIRDVINPTETLTIPFEESDSIDMDLQGKGVKSVSFEKGITSVSLWGADSLEEIVLPSTIDSLYLSGVKNLKTINIPKGLSYLNLYEFGGESLDVPASVSTLVLDYCENLKNVKLRAGLSDFTMWGCPKAEITIPSTVNNIYCDDYSGITFSPDNPKYSSYEGSLYVYDGLFLAASDRETINIKPGTKSILEGALSMAYAATTINIPDSVELLKDGALAGTTKVKKLKLPKNLVSIYSCAFEGLGADSIEIPSSVQYVDENAFGGYKGVVNIENGFSYVLSSRNGAIYNADYSCLLYYPKKRTALNLDYDCLTIAFTAVNGCAFKTLDLPEGIEMFHLDLSDCNKLTTINIPSSVWYIDVYGLQYCTPDSLKNYTVDKKNEFYSSYQGCLYSRDKSYLYSVPRTKKELKIARGCVTIDYYVFGDREEDPISVEIPGTVSCIEGIHNIGYAKVDCGTRSAQILEQNYLNGWYPVSYEFVDSSKDILRKIVVSDDIQLKKGDKDEYVTYSFPPGLISVSSFTASQKKTNIFAKVSFTSTKKSVCKVNKKSGRLTPVKKGTATIKVKCELADGTSKTFKTKVTVK